jgi:hypothetical protein
MPKFSIRIQEHPFLNHLKLEALHIRDVALNAHRVEGVSNELTRFDTLV